MNEAAGIVTAVERAARLDPHEIILVDGGSTDETVRLADDLPCEVLRSSRGRALQQNAGAARATGDVLLFLHADCWLEPSARGQIERCLNSPRIPGGAFQQRIEAKSLIFRWLEAGNAFRVAGRRLPFGDQAIFLRRELFERLGGFPQVSLMEEVLLMRQLRDHGRIALLPGPLHVSARRWQEYGPVRQTFRNWLILLAESLGVSPDTLAAFYAAHGTSK